MTTNPARLQLYDRKPFADDGNSSSSSNKTHSLSMGLQMKFRCHAKNVINLSLWARSVSIVHTACALQYCIANRECDIRHTHSHTHNLISGRCRRRRHRGRWCIRVLLHIYPAIKHIYKFLHKIVCSFAVNKSPACVSASSRPIPFSRTSQ